MVKKLAIHGGTPVTEMPPLKHMVGIEEADAVRRLIKEVGILSSFRGGEQVRQFEEDFASYVGTEYAVATTSGTTALHACVSALDLKPDDEVLVPALTFVSTASVVLQEHAKVVFVDIDEYFCMDPNDLAAKVNRHSRAIIPVHLYGQVADMKSINEIAKKHKLAVIEDACQSHGAKTGGQRTGSLGDAGCFSFFQTKNMTTGEGGMVTTNDKLLYERIRLAREHGSPAKSPTWYNYHKLGFNYNMTEMQGLIGQIQLKKLDSMNEIRRANAESYNTHLANKELTLPQVRDDVYHVHHNFPVLLPKRHANQRDFFVKALAAEGIPVDVAYPCTLYQTDLFKHQAKDSNCPRAEDMASRLFTLFTDAAITNESIRKTAEAIEKVLAYLDANN